jgi:hypothetical protein
MPVPFADTYASFLTGNELDGYLSDNELPDLDGIFDFDGASQGAESSRLRSASRRDPTPGSSWRPGPDDEAWSEGYSRRSRAAEALHDDGDDGDADADDGLLGHLSDTSIEADDDDSETEAGVAHDRASEWKIDHSSGDHKLNGTLLGVQTRRARTS